MSEKKIWTLFGISVLLSIASICISFIRSEPLTFDGMSVLVGILSLLVTLLLGWQIYTFVDINNRVKKEVHEFLNKKADSVYKGIVGNTLIYQVEDAKFYSLEKDWNRVLSLYNNILRGYIRLGDKENIESMIDNMKALLSQHTKEISAIYILMAEQVLKDAIHYTDKAYELLLIINRIRIE